MDAFVDIRGKIRIQDMAAGYLLVREAGGVVLDENLKPLDADLGYGTKLSFIAAADADTAHMVASKNSRRPVTEPAPRPGGQIPDCACVCPGKGAWKGCNCAFPDGMVRTNPLTLVLFCPPLYVTKVREPS